MGLNQYALDALKETSRTFFIPISRLPEGVQDAYGLAYLCMRAIDEIEDHLTLSNSDKAVLLRAISLTIQTFRSADTIPPSVFEEMFHPFVEVLPQVTLRLAIWLRTAPAPIAPRIWEATAGMAERMAHWASVGWKIRTEADLDSYTFGVAGAVGVMLCDLWAFYRGDQFDRSHAVEFGRGLQAVNILKNRAEDLARGVDLFPEGWTQAEMDRYARQNLDAADAYLKTLGEAPFRYFMKIPQVLAYATLATLAQGESKLTRAQVSSLMEQFTRVPPM